jgi:hypothetical protein
LRRLARPTLIEFDRYCCNVLFVEPDDTVALSTFADAAVVSRHLADTIRSEALVLCDEFRRVVAILFDPPAELALAVGWSLLDALDVRAAQTMLVTVGRRAAVTAGHGAQYAALRRTHMLQGLQLLDITVVGDDATVASVAISHDPDPVWFDPVAEPFAA